MQPIPTEEALIETLENRFSEKKIYSQCGIILLSLNPYCDNNTSLNKNVNSSNKNESRTGNTIDSSEKDGLGNSGNILSNSNEILVSHDHISENDYTMLENTNNMLENNITEFNNSDISQMQHYFNNHGLVDPHIFATTESAIQNFPFSPHHTLIITGESGSGKTHNTESVLRYAIHRLSGDPSLHKSLLFAHQILEFFGNAKTPINPNSSRFGKLITLNVENDVLVSAKIDVYLLEKSRVTHSENGGTFHVLHHALANDEMVIENDYVKQGRMESRWKWVEEKLKRFGYVENLKDCLVAIVLLGSVQFCDSECHCKNSDIDSAGDVNDKGINNNNSANTINTKLDSANIVFADDNNIVFTNDKIITFANDANFIDSNIIEKNTTKFNDIFNKNDSLLDNRVVNSSVNDSLAHDTSTNTYTNNIYPKSSKNNTFSSNNTHLLKKGDSLKAIQFICKTFNISRDTFEELLTTSYLKIGNEVVKKNNSLEKAICCRDTFARNLYARIFEKVVELLNCGINNKNVKNECSVYKNVKNEYISDKKRDDKNEYISDKNTEDKNTDDKNTDDKNEYFKDKNTSSFSSHQKSYSSSLSILDIYGFESFKTNNFDQFLINWSNEKIQNEFTRRLLHHNQQFYLSEGIPFPEVTFPQNDPILHLIEKKCGIADLIDEESFNPIGTVESLLIKIIENNCKDSAFLQSKCGNRIGIGHYAGRVEYCVDDFLKKNCENVGESFENVIENVVGEIFCCKNVEIANVDIENLEIENLDRKNVDCKNLDCKNVDFKSSDCKNLDCKIFSDGKKLDSKIFSDGKNLDCKIFSDSKNFSDCNENTNNIRKSENNCANSNKKTTTITHFKTSMEILFKKINTTQIHYVRCIRPNKENKKWTFDRTCVAKQIKSSGVLETIKLSELTYPFIVNKKMFLDRYWRVDRDMSKNNEIDKHVDKHVDKDVDKHADISIDNKLDNNVDNKRYNKLDNDVDDKVDNTSYINVDNKRYNKLDNNSKIEIYRESKSIYDSKIIYDSKFNNDSSSFSKIDGLKIGKNLCFLKSWVLRDLEEKRKSLMKRNERLGEMIGNFIIFSKIMKNNRKINSLKIRKNVTDVSENINCLNIKEDDNLVENGNHFENIDVFKIIEDDINKDSNIKENNINRDVEIKKNDIDIKEINKEQIENIKVFDVKEPIDIKSYDVLNKNSIEVLNDKDNIESVDIKDNIKDIEIVNIKQNINDSIEIIDVYEDLETLDIQNYKPREFLIEVSDEIENMFIEKIGNKKELEMGNEVENKIGNEIRNKLGSEKESEITNKIGYEIDNETNNDYIIENKIDNEIHKDYKIDNEIHTDYKIYNEHKIPFEDDKNKIIFDNIIDSQIKNDKIVFSKNEIVFEKDKIDENIIEEYKDDTTIENVKDLENIKEKYTQIKVEDNNENILRSIKDENLNIIEENNINILESIKDNSNNMFENKNTLENNLKNISEETLKNISEEILKNTLEGNKISSEENLKNTLEEKIKNTLEDNKFALKDNKITLEDDKITLENNLKNTLENNKIILKDNKITLKENNDLTANIYEKEINELKSEIDRLNTILIQKDTTIKKLEFDLSKEKNHPRSPHTIFEFLTVLFSNHVPAVAVPVAERLSFAHLIAKICVHLAESTKCRPEIFTEIFVYEFADKVALFEDDFFRVAFFVANLVELRSLVPRCAELETMVSSLFAHLGGQATASLAALLPGFGGDSVFLKIFRRPTSMTSLRAALHEKVRTLHANAMNENFIRCFLEFLLAHVEKVVFNRILAEERILNAGRAAQIKRILDELCDFCREYGIELKMNALFGTVKLVECAEMGMGVEEMCKCVEMSEERINCVLSKIYDNKKDCSGCFLEDAKLDVPKSEKKEIVFVRPRFVEKKYLDLVFKEVWGSYHFW